jgi:hypothetical protein
MPCHGDDEPEEYHEACVVMSVDRRETPEYAPFLDYQWFTS